MSGEVQKPRQVTNRALPRGVGSLQPAHSVRGAHAISRRKRGGRCGKPSTPPSWGWSVRGLRQCLGFPRKRGHGTVNVAHIYVLESLRPAG